MGICKYCGLPAGFLKSEHKECKEKYESGKAQIISLIKTSIYNNENLEDIHNQIKQIATTSYITDEDLKNEILEAWQMAVEQAFSDGILTEQEETRLRDMIGEFNFNRDILNLDNAYLKFVKGSVLREVMEGKIHQRVKVEGSLPFNFLKKETLIWFFKNSKYYEMRTLRHYEGGTQGFSIRIAKGLYYRTNAFQGRPVETEKLTYIDTGFFAITDKNIYFGGSTKNFRIKYEKIVSFIPYDDGIQIQRDSMSAKPQIFVTGDGWFTYNLLTNLAKL